MNEISSRVANLSPEQLAKLAYELKASRASKAQELPKRIPGEPCPLSFAQQRLWFIAQLEPDNPAYNCMEALRMTGKLNVPLLEQTLNEVVRRHEALRTTFELVGGEPSQIVSSEIKPNSQVIDLKSLPESERERQVSKLSSEALRRTFDLTQGPLLRVLVLRVNEQEHAILFTTHHIISDAWSLEILVREVIDLYSAFVEGRPSPLAELPFQYADFATWQRQRLTGPAFAKHLEYWRQHLEGAPHVLALPTDHPRPAVLTRRGSYETLTLSPELSYSLRALSRREGVTLFMTMLAAFDVLLSRYSGQTDFLIGTDIANRNYGTTESLIGFFVNQLVLRVDLAGDPTFNELLERVKEVTLSGYAHQEAPFEKVVEMLNPKRNLSHAPLFQVKLVLQNASTGNLELPELAIAGVEAETPIAKFDLTLMISEADRTSAAMEYSTDLFESSTVRRMLTKFESILAAAVRDPEQHISQLELLSSAERHQLLVERNDTHIPYPHSRCIHELFEEQVALTPEAPALTFYGQHLSYAELNARANQLAHYLREVGVKAETRVSVFLDRSIEMVVALIAILKSGGVYIPLDPEYPTERLAFILDDVSSPIILTHSSLVDELPSDWAQTLCLDTESELWSALPTTEPADIDNISSEQLAYVMYTSGSTGQPKGVAVPHRGVVRLVKQSAYVNFGPGEVFLQLAPVTFDASTLEIWGALLNGGQLVLMPPGALSLPELSTVLRTEGVTVLWLTAGLFHLMVEQELAALACVTQVVAGGDVLSTEHVRRLLRAKEGRGVVVNGYGPTETTTFACCHRMSSETALEHGVPIGSPIGNTQVFVLGEKMELVGDGMLGHLYIGGDGLARCYHNQPELTAERFVPHPFSTAGGERLYRTGDYVRWRAEGTLEFVGRVDTQVKIRGYRVEPGEVEAVLGRHGSVQECAVVPRSEANGEKRLVAYVVDGNHEHGVNAFELREYLRERLPEFMLPSAIVALESLPLTLNGKVDRQELAGREVQVGGERPYAPPRTSTEEMLCDIWQEVLHAERVGIDDNFFDLGGDSILSIRVIVKARAASLELNVQQLFQSQTVRELAEELAGAPESSAAIEATAPFSLISERDRLRLPAGVVDAYPLTALQAGMLFHSELAPAAGHYHDIFTFHLRLAYDGEALRAALQQVLELHPVLRSSFNLSDFSEPLQLVHQEVAVPLRLGDLRALSPLAQEEYLADWMATEKKRRFDWGKAPLLCFEIERRAEDSFQFSFSFHHAILDGWSVATLLTELFNLYVGLQTGAGASVAAVRAWFRDYVAAERAVLNSEAARQYWTTRLSEVTPSRLPRLGRSTGPSRVAVEQVQLSAELSVALKELARTAGVPLKSVLLAAHLRALNVLSGSPEVVTGMVSHGRPETADGERVLGLFLNTLPFRQRLGGGTWLALVQETFAAERELLPFRRYPMARMQQELGHEGPLFEVIFNFVHFHVYEELQHVSGVEVLAASGVAETNYTFGVDFSLALAGSQLRLELHYDAAELGAEQMAAVAGHYRTILESMTRSPHERYEQQCLLSPEERQTILYQWNEPALSELESECYQQLFEMQVARTPQAVAAVLGDEQLTYAELNGRANQLAHHLQALGVGPEVAVGVLLERSLETLVALLAIFKAGGAYVPLDPEYPEARLRFMVRDAGPALLVTQEKLSNRLADTVVQRLCVDADWAEIARESADNPRRLASAANLAYIIYTSGSSGTPKGVMITQGGMLNCLQGMQQRYGLTAQDRFLMHISLSFDASILEVFWPLMVGARVAIAPAAGRLEHSALLRYMAQQSVTCAGFVPSLLGVLVKDPRLSELSRLRYVLTGAEKLPLAVMQEFQRLSRAELHNVYGPTETALAATEWTCEAGAERVLIGRPLGNTQVYVLDGQLEPLPVGIAGELYIGGAGVGWGYAGQAELTAERFVPDRFSGKAGARLYRTGDLVRYDQQGVLEFVGRVDEQVKLRGYRIELGEIEAVLRGHQQVREAAVVLREEDGDKRLVAYVVADAQASELRAYLKEQLPDYMVPSFVVALNELPLLPNGKLNRRALPAPESVSAAAAEYEAPRTATEELLSGLWASVLQVNRVGINDNFFELGGHSLLATQLISRVRETFGVELWLRELFERPTVAGLAERVEAALRGGMRVTAPPLVPVSREQQLPLSHAQERLWFLDQLEPGRVAYNIPIAVRLKGRLDVKALKRTLNEVVRRHEALRTTFVRVNGEQVQAISPADQVDMPLIDLSQLPEEQREADASQLAAAEAQRPFDLSVGPLLRVRLLRLGAEDHVVLFTMHHIITDGWSTGILMREVAALYEAYIEGRESPLPELEIQYADYAVWQREWLQGDVLDQQLAYWRRQLGGELPVLQLPTDKPRPPVQSYRGRNLNFTLPSQLTAELKKLSNAKRVTLYMTLLAAFKILLWRYSGQSEVVVGTPIAGRNHLAAEGIIGLFVNTLVLRTSLSGNPSFSELLDRVREVTLCAYAHQDLPFEKLVEELQPERDMGRSPLFQVMFVLQNATAETLRLAGLEASDVTAGDENAKFDLTLGLTEIDGELQGSLQYSVELFDAATIGRLVQHYELLLESMVADPDRQLSQLPLLLEEDRHKLLIEWNDTHVAYDLQKCVHQLFEAQVRQTPEAGAVVAGQVRLSYGELESRAEKLARRLRREGVGPEQRVGVLVGRGAAMVVAPLGVLKAGGAYVPLDAAYPLERLSLMADDAQLSVLVAEEGLNAEFVRQGVKLVRLDKATGECMDDASESATEDRQVELPAPSVTPENVAYVIYTSGSTGRPKGVAITHRSAVAFMHWARDVFPPSVLRGVLASTSLSFDLSVFELFVTLSSGGKIILADNALHLSTLEAANEVTLINTVPSAMAELLRIGAVPDSVQTINLAGEALATSLVQQIYEQTRTRQVWNLYGPSEDTTYSTSVLIEKNQSGPMVIGRPIANTQAYICDEMLQLLPVGVPGQLLLAGDGLARGYIGRPALTAERFLPNPFSTAGGARLYRTGDLARYRVDGQIEFLGRADSQLKLRGFRIEPGEIETRLKEHSSVREAVVIATTEVAPDDKRLVAYVVTAQSGATVNDLRDYLRGRLPEYMVPSAFMLMDAFPLTPNGKIDRRALPSPDRSTKTDSELTTPRDVLELQLVEIWKEVLRREQIGLTDNFFDLGGYSLLAVRLIDKVERLVGQKIPLSILFQGATVEQLAATLRQHGGKVKEQLLVSIQPEGSRPPLFLVHSASGNVMSYVALARRLGREQPVYGLQSKGLHPDRKPTTRIEDMASEYLQELTTVQPEGPYHLGGWSMGGVIAFEMARQLTVQGKSVAPLMLIDSTIQTGRVKKNGLDDVSLLLALAQHHGLVFDDADQAFEDLRSLSLDEQLEFCLEKGAVYNQFPPDIGVSQLRQLFELFKVNIHAAEKYRPAKSAQQVILFQAAAAFPKHAAETLKRWRKVAEVVAAHSLPGDHYSIVTEPNVTLLAEQIRSVLTA